MDMLNSEYDKLAELQLKLSYLLKDDWEAQRKEQRASRKLDIEQRQVEFDKELALQDKERRKKWTPKRPTNKKKMGLCDELLELLRNEEQLEIVNESDHRDVDTSILILPPSILESFWSLEIDPPVMRSEIEPTVKLLMQTKSELE
ncbi:hypothetical protein G6F57_001548 [Rhizopus arrhizus]|uniref:Uncharacterized protein n=1 Tax=Rhizopus oryzae TaxID=64495 RepID=A0A9P6XFW8_RHIOR|nr:hypothetical protein G6F23_006535 [Rhizopus arrhizus]KAG1410775.1 hypothetical protein G6F58_008919 [Rhizopus delemar]KAG0769139.1 hypothetical protein G6F24_001322 [Rhizopus arrhizus]KAG0790724.1 hypothetical protein G6F22_006333 [Rhizopus arrhizus]KAG0797584.1 hypothetical protein G6F21_000419 [Rhizopus arrhizus]